MYVCVYVFKPEPSSRIPSTYLPVHQKPQLHSIHQADTPPILLDIETELPLILPECIGAVAAPTRPRWLPHLAPRVPTYG